MYALIWLAVALSICYMLFDVILLTAFDRQKKKPEELQFKTKLSVIIASKNEAFNLKKNLPLILKQNYPDFEVIVVNDHSTDDSLDILSKFQSQYSHLKVLNNTLSPSKKNALKIGIDYSTCEHLIFTDADCKPLSSEWLNEIQHCFSEENSIVLGYSPYRQAKGWLNEIIRFETCQTAINYFGMANLGMPYMGVGRNLAYKKSVFEALKGFKAHENIKSGDDDLLINEASEKFTVVSCLDPKTFVESEAESTLKSWIQQKRRHISTAPHYKLRHQLILGSQFIIKFLFWFFIIPFSMYLFFNNELYLLVLTSVIMIIKLVLSQSLFTKLIVKDLWAKSIILEFQLICLQLYIFS
jgi:cellulose synthase/poly-beta-1,6-N-acetylglucosamine synthase-like glycosyltransferase